MTSTSLTRTLGAEPQEKAQSRNDKDQEVGSRKDLLSAAGRGRVKAPGVASRSQGPGVFALIEISLL